MGGREVGGLAAGVYLLQLGQVAQSQQVHWAHSQTPVTQQSQQGEAFTRPANEAVALTRSPIAAKASRICFFMIQNNSKIL